MPLSIKGEILTNEILLTSLFTLSHQHKPFFLKALVKITLINF